MARRLSIIVDSEISLEPVSYEHMYELFNLVETSRQSLREWLPWVDMVTNLEEERQYINYYQSRFAKEGALTTTIKYCNQVAGVISLNYIDRKRQATAIGYWLGDEFRRLGVMGRSCKAIVTYCFMTLGLHKVKIFCATKNYASQRIPLRLGFTKEGCIREGEWLYDHYVDLNVYSMLAQEWMGRILSQETK